MSELQVVDLGRKGNWREVADAARTTVSMEPGSGEPSNEWKKEMLLSEHSPIRKLIYRWKWINLPYCYSVHFVRHKFGIEHFVSSQREDRTSEDRSEKSQKEPVIHECEANAQAIINISRDRLCGQSKDETTEAWVMFLENIVRHTDPELADVCVRECVYRGFCPERKSCGFVDTEEFELELKHYRKLG